MKNYKLGKYDYIFKLVIIVCFLKFSGLVWDVVMMKYMYM